MPDPYGGKTKQEWELEGARRMAFILSRGAVLNEATMKGTTEPST